VSGHRVRARAGRRARALVARLPSEPLDRIRSIKAKLGVLVAASCTATALIVWLGLTRLGWAPRYTLPLAVLGALLVTQLLAHGMTRPLRQMTAAARTMTVAGGRVDVRATSRDEVGELARAFTAMAAELADADGQRRDLLANVGHELRTPVAALRGQLENLADGVVPADQAALAAALAQSERLAELVEELLELAHLESGPVELDRQPVALAPLLEGAVAEVSEARPGRRWRVDVEPADHVLLADPRRLRQVVVNLLDNAGRHSPCGGLVTVAATATPDGTCLRVTDEGPGIPAAERDRVFERFTHAAAGQHGGTGLGLAIARWAVDLHGGRIGVAPDEPGTPGCTLTVFLPKELPMPAGPQQPTAAPLVTPPPHAAPAPSPLAAFWPPPGRPAPGWLVLGAVAAGVAAAAWFFGDLPGLSATIVAVLVAVPVLLVTGRTLGRWDWSLVVLAMGLTLAVTLRDTAWLVILAALAALGCVAVALARSWGWLQIAAAPVAWGLAGLRALPWSARSVRAGDRVRGSGPVLRGVLAALLLGAAFAALLSAADPVFERVVSAVLPDIDLGTMPARVVVGIVVALVALGAAFLGLAAPRWERLGEAAGGRRDGRPAGEWAIPLAVVDLLLIAFVVVQAAVLFGGHDVVLEGTGVTYAERARTGFGQLAAVTALTVLLLVVSVRMARRQDRRLLLVLGGTLCAVSLVVVASALWRLALYEQAYGHTVARLVGGVLEIWMAVVVVLCGIALADGGRWLPRAVVTSAAVTLLGLVALSPDRWVAERNLDRLAATGTFDADYANELSADAVPTLDRLPEPYRGCALDGWTAQGVGPEAWYSWNLARDRAADVLAARPAPEQPDWAACHAGDRPNGS
jgi:signal transduction histidine kinase